MRVIVNACACEWLSSSEFRVLCVLIDAMNAETGQCNPSYSNIAKRSGISPKSIERLVSRLIKKKVIKRVQNAGRSNFYEVMMTLFEGNVEAETPLNSEVGTPLNSEVGTPLNSEVGTPLKNEGYPPQIRGVPGSDTLLDEKIKETDARARATPTQSASRKKGNGKSRFIPPTPQEVDEYSASRPDKPRVDGERFCDHYEANGWMRGKNKIKDWKACVRTWERNQKQDQPQNQPTIQKGYI